MLLLVLAICSCVEPDNREGKTYCWTDDVAQQAIIVKCENGVGCSLKITK